RVLVRRLGPPALHPVPARRCSDRSLRLVIRALRLEPDHLDEKEDAKARIRAAEAALGRLEELEEEDWVRDDTAQRLRGLYNFRRDRKSTRLNASHEWTSYAVFCLQ